MSSRRSLLTITNQIIDKFVKMGPEKWIKGADARNKYGDAISPFSKEACSFCNNGVARCVIGKNGIAAALTKLDNAFFTVNAKGMVGFNDQDENTFGHNLEAWLKLRSYLKKHKDAR